MVSILTMNKEHLHGNTHTQPPRVCEKLFTPTTRDNASAAANNRKHPGFTGQRRPDRELGAIERQWTSPADEDKSRIE